MQKCIKCKMHHSALNAVSAAAALLKCCCTCCTRVNYCQKPKSLFGCNSKEGNIMKLKIKKRQHEQCPAGPAKAKLVRVGQPRLKTKKYCEEEIQLTFEAVVEGETYLVYRKFCADMTEGSELYGFVRTMLGGKFDPFVDEAENVDFELLIGRAVDIVVTHYQEQGYARPHVGIGGAYPRGTMVDVPKSFSPFQTLMPMSRE